MADRPRSNQGADYGPLPESMILPPNLNECVV
jgi:hypothetical protein